MSYWCCLQDSLFTLENNTYNTYKQFKDTNIHTHIYACICCPYLIGDGLYIDTHTYTYVYILIIDINGSCILLYIRYVYIIYYLQINTRHIHANLTTYIYLSYT